MLDGFETLMPYNHYLKELIMLSTDRPDLILRWLAGAIQADCTVARTSTHRRTPTAGTVQGASGGRELKL
jgi:hypothetical protein